MYLLLAIVGALVPLSQFVPWVAVNGFDLTLMMNELFANRISSFFGLDLIISAGVLIVFALADSARYRAAWHGWLAVLLTLCLGVSFGLPFYLYLREKRIADSLIFTP